MKSGERRGLTPIALREKSASFERETLDRQSASFRRYGVIGDFDDPYLTMNPDYEAVQVGVSGEVYKRGHISRGRKLVHCSRSSRIAPVKGE